MLRNSNIFRSHMYIAFEQAVIAFQHNEVPIGAAIVCQKTHTVIAKAFNYVESTQNVLAHAEMLAIAQAQAMIKSKFLNQYSIYITLQPCLMCFAAIMLSKITRIYFATTQNIVYPITKGIEIYEGEMEKESSSLLKKFFQSQRI